MIPGEPWDNVATLAIVKAIHSFVSVATETVNVTLVSVSYGKTTIDEYSFVGLSHNDQKSVLREEAQETVCVHVYVGGMGL